MWLPGGSSDILVGGQWRVARWLPSTPGWDTDYRFPAVRCLGKKHKCDRKQKAEKYISKKIGFIIHSHTCFAFFWTCDWFLKRSFLRDFWFRRYARMNQWYNPPSEMTVPLKLFEPPNNTHRARGVVLQPLTDCKSLECVTRKVGKGCSSVTMQCFDASWRFNFAMNLEMSKPLI